VVSIAENQVASCAALHDAGSHVYLGNASEVTPEAIAQAAMAVLASPAWWSRLAECSGELVDGKGAQRVARRLLAGALQLRAASAQDADTILSWRNDPAVRRYAGADREIGAAEHGRWYERVLADPDCHLLIGEDALGAAGVLRYDVAARVAKVSIYLAPARIGGGAGAALLAAGEQWLALHRPDIDTIGADVQAGNRASVRLFTNSGYRVQAQHYVRSVAGRRSP
jgi:RimJ/RimL family protein N-acetyltransferase